MDYEDCIAELRTNHEQLPVELAGFHGVSDVLEWRQRTGRTQAAVDIIGQDDFNYDFLSQLEPEGGWLVFGIT
jgi:hypothetical protein